MAIKDILVHLDGGARDGARLATAIELAGRFGARLSGLFARLDRFGPSVVARRESDALIEAANAAEQAFAAATKGMDARFWRLAHGEAGHVASETVICARFADLVVMGQHAEGDGAPADLVEQVVQQSGRPVLIVPAVGDWPKVGTNVLVAWNAGREAARALHDALPLMAGAHGVEVVTIRHDQPRPGGGEAVPPVNIADHLAAHGIGAVRENLAAEDIGIMDLLLSRAFDLGADLLVMGGHSGFLKGSGTRHILKHMTLPVLMSQ